MFSLSKEALDKNNISLEEVLFLIITANKIDFTGIEESLVSKGFISTEYNKEYKPIGLFVTNKGKETLNKVSMDSEKTIDADGIDERIKNLVPQLQVIFPKGVNFNNQYWRGNKSDITIKLKKFFQKYGDYTDEQILEATRAYVQGFNGNYKFMRLLQYFIWKEEMKDGTKVRVSELANYLENAGQTNDLREDWTSSLV